MEKKPNRLIHEKSPYLLQHAYNPVDWYPWEPEAFERAAREDKPVFLSVGYSTCHWCHVMERESFEDPEVAEIMNDTFISIKVDREERPDIDGFYMQACQMMTGSGGWPLTIIMTSEKQPFFAATYIPKHSRRGLTGLMEFIPRIKRLWETDRHGLISTSVGIIEAMKSSIPVFDGEKLGLKTLRRAYGQLSSRFDKRHGGFSWVPKFPIPHNLLFLLRHWRRTGEERALKMVEMTLQAMRRGGIYDHIGFGFHRYSTDERWLVPHFEKMLYDQALLLMAYAEAYQATGNRFYRRVTEEVIDYVLRDMASPEGGFYTAEDAESEGEEGRFYLWSMQEMRENLSPEEAELAISVFNVKEVGNFRERSTMGKGQLNILHIATPLTDQAVRLGIPFEDLEAHLEAVRWKLFRVRESRVRPFRDDKVLTSWNGLMVAALAKASRALGKAKYAEAARRAVAFIMDRLLRNGRLLHRYRDGESAIPGFLDDYAFLIWGLLELYETEFDAQLLRVALELNGMLLKHFWDPEEGGFFITADDGEHLPVRRKEVYDGALPSGNSVAMFILLKLASITGNMDLKERVKSLERTFSSPVSVIPSAYTQLLTALEYSLVPSYVVVIVGDREKGDTRSMLEALYRRFIPNKTVLLKSWELEEIADFVKSFSTIGGKATAYVCIEHLCKKPTTDPEEMLEMLEG